MKRLILIFLLIPSLCFGADAAKIMGVASDPSGTNNVNKVDAITWGTTAGNATKVMGVAAAAAASCNVATNEIGNRTQETNNRTLSAGSIWAQLGTAECTGTLETAYIYYNHDTEGGAVKVCIYSAAGSEATPNHASNVKIGCSGVISTGTSATWLTGSIGSGSVTKDAKYWVVMLAGAAGFYQTVSAGNATMFYDTTDSWYASPPDNLASGYWNSSGNDGLRSVYVRIQ